MRFQALDGWRGAGAVIVAIFHLNVYSHLYSFPLVRNAYPFVDFFFVLSGFVIAASYGSRIGDTEDLKQFVVRRIGRIYPLHLAVLLALVLVELGKLAAVSVGASAHFAPFSEATSVQSVITNIFLLQSFGFHDYLTWNFPSWSISSEFYVNFLFGIAVLATAVHTRYCLSG
jgi:peptidoglycan/LPS O-acetylase OafA/YrhL